MTIEIRHLQKAYRESTPLKDVNAVINEGDVIAVIGPSGCGKSTFIRCLNMIDPPTSGQILLDGEDITDKKYNLTKLRQKIGMVFQSYNLFEHLTVVENVMLALTDLKHLPRQEAYDIAVRELTKVGLGERLLRYPDELSGGQKQRVSIARTLAVNPDVILLDEPTSALDPTMVREVEAVIRDLAKSGKTMLIVTHEMRLARAISNRVFFLDNGVLYEDGTPEQIFDNPTRERTKAFINHLKVFKYKTTAAEFDYAEFERRLNKFADNNRIAEERSQTAHSFLSWFATGFIPEHVSDSTVCSIITEYGEDDNSIKVIVYISATPENQENIRDAFSRAFARIGADGAIEEIEDEDFFFKVTCKA